MTGETTRMLRLCNHHLALLRRAAHHGLLLRTARPFHSTRERKRRGQLWKTLVGISVAVPVAAGVQYAVSDRRQRRKMRIVVEGIGRFCRSLSVGVFISLDYWWTTKVALRGKDEVSQSLSSN
ncbi:uncharacterized aarF domain-containing protein kinase 5-like [Nematolebias whitei]|uniref:uncharacterized aarF domain-containing protein kinase 5-like n=1 Tax=Nematolebias whitei TaxID=451745 RepID=UPI00189B38F3|nr:uncharacterized aarF domain-containing protein kinase 5-like [Nematolebias whitei]